MTVPSLSSEYADLDPLQTRIDTHKRYSETIDDVNHAVLETLRLTGSEFILDIGCGTAEFLHQLTAAGHTGRLAGLDTSAAAVQAAAQIQGVEGICASAEKIPVADDSCDVITARHMLYHLDDPVRALREFQRTVRPGGVVCVVVNHARTCHNTHQLVADIAARYGITSVDGMINETVTSDTVPDMMQDIYSNVSVTWHDNALVIPEIAPAVRFAEALFQFCGITPDSPHKASIRTDVETELRTWFSTHDSWRDPKGYTVITSRISKGWTGPVQG